MFSCQREAGNIAFHIVNAQSEQANMEETMLGKSTKGYLGYARISVSRKKVDKDSMLYLRFGRIYSFYCPND